MTSALISRISNVVMFVLGLLGLVEQINGSGVISDFKKFSDNQKCLKKSPFSGN